MPSVVHIVVTNRFAGVERYICNVAPELARREWTVSIIGGESELMASATGGAARCLPGATLLQALRSLARVGRQDVCHVHMTKAEGVAVAGCMVHRASVVSTRHFAARRGSSSLARAIAPVISAGIAREIAISDFVAGQLERPPSVVLPNAVPSSGYLWSPLSRVVLVLQRLDPEKETRLALDAWARAKLWEQGWELRIVGDGPEREALQRHAASERLERVTFAGWARDVQPELEGAGILLATAPAEPFGLSVLEAMAAGVPVVASRSGGHLETVGRLIDARLFAAGDASAGARELLALIPDDIRAAASRAAREFARAEFGLDHHVDLLTDQYELARRGGRFATPFSGTARGSEIR